MKLTKAMIRTIRKQHAKGWRMEALAKRFGVTRQRIGQVVRGKVGA